MSIKISTFSMKKNVKSALRGFKMKCKIKYLKTAINDISNDYKISIGII